jgi:hypothetical protein
MEKQPVRSFEDALKVEGKQASEVLVYEHPQNVEEEITNAHRKLRLIAKAKKAGWKPDYTNYSQKKWFPIYRWDAESSRWVFSDSSYYYGITFTILGSRFAFKTENDASEFGKDTEDLHNILSQD